MPAARTRAQEEPAKTIHLFVSRSAEKRRGASWVLSPISARKTGTKTAAKVRHMAGESTRNFPAVPPVSASVDTVRERPYGVGSPGPSPSGRAAGLLTTGLK